MSAAPPSEDAVRMSLYEFFLQHKRPPVAAELAGPLGATPAEVEDAFRRLAEAHVITLVPGTTYIWMANPLSAVPTAFAVDSGEERWWGNCVWDAMGILAMLQRDGTVSTFCPDCAQALRVRIAGDEVVEGSDLVVHYAVPARHWWDDIGFT